MPFRVVVRIRRCQLFRCQLKNTGPQTFPNWPQLYKFEKSTTKGQIILKVILGGLKFSQKMKKRIPCSSKNEFVRSFFREFEDTKSPFEII